MVGVGVGENDSLDPTQPLSRRPRRPAHRLGPGLELHNSIPVLEEVDVHSSPEISAKQPNPVSDLLRLPHPAPSLVLPPMPTLWKIGMVVLVACLLASMAIAIVRLTTTPTEILGDGFRGLPARHSTP